MSEDTKFVASNKDKAIFEFRSEVDNHLAPNVTLISNDNAQVKGHSNILASCHYFRELFNKDKTGNPQLVFHESFTGDVLEFVVKFIYTGEYSLLSVEKLSEVIRATSKEKFNIPALAKGYLLKQLDAPGGLNQSNWHLFYKNGIKLDLGEEYFDRIYALLKEKHPEFYKSEEFKDLTFDQIYQIMSSPNRPFESITTIMEATLIWTREHTEVGMDKLAELSQICTNPIQNEYPQAASTPTDPHCTTKRKRTRSTSTQITNQRSKRSMVEVYDPPKYSWESAQLLFFGQTEWSEPRYLLSYLFKTGKIKKMAKLPIEDLVHSTLLVSQDRIYSIGGDLKYEDLDSVWSFPIRDLENLDKAWDKEPNLNRNGYEPPTILFQNTIYTFPSSSSGIEKWDLDGNPGIWENTNWDMLHDRFTLGVALLDNIIYMIAGQEPEKNVPYSTELLENGESYNILDGTQSLLPNLSQAKYHLKVVALEDRIYAIGGYNENIQNLASVESYKPGDSSWEQVAHMNQARGRGMGAFVLDDMIYVVGGNGYVEEPTMERYCPQEDRWTMVDVKLPLLAELYSSALLGPNNF